jgi:hypothetical protein
VAKDVITSYSTTNASNTDVGGVDIQGTAAVSNFDNAVRELMTHLAETNAGTAPWADTMTIGDASDLTKEIRFELSGITTATTRVITVPDADITLVGKASPTFTDQLTITSTDDGAGGGPELTLYRNSATPTASDGLGRVVFYGEDTAGNQEPYAFIQSIISDATSTNEDALFDIQTVVAGTLASRVVVGAGLYTPNATGGDKGADSINASAVYDDNVLLTCYVFDAAIDGTIEDAKWDAKVPDKVLKDGTVVVRNHNDMRKFRARLGTEFDPLDIDAYTKHWKEKRHLTALPNEATFDPVKGMPAGSWIQRLVETVEIQAVHIAQLNDRLKAIGA